MCLITFAYNVHPKHPLIIVANRDEFYERPTAAAQFWENEPTILGGRDLLQGGSWLGVSTNKRFAAITNYRDPRLPERGLHSRGEIVQQFLTTSKSTHDFIAQLRSSKQQYGGYNVLLFDGHQMHHYNNIFDEHQLIEAGVHSLSNATLNSPWPKAQLAKDHLHAALQRDNVEMQQLITLLSSEAIAPDEQLPDTGVGIHLERLLSSPFVKMPNYGTRCSTVLRFNDDKSVHFLERTYEQGQIQFDRIFTI